MYHPTSGDLKRRSSSLRVSPEQVSVVIWEEFEPTPRNPPTSCWLKMLDTIGKVADAVTTVTTIANPDSLLGGLLRALRKRGS